MDPKTKERFLKVLGMMGSAHEGERDAAANRAAAIIKGNVDEFKALVDGQGGGGSGAYRDYNAGFAAGLAQGRAEGASNRDHKRDEANPFTANYRQKDHRNAGPHPRGYFLKLQWILSNPNVMELLNSWERSFAEDVYRRQQPLSHKQRGVIDRIIETAHIYGHEYPGDAS